MCSFERKVALVRSPLEATWLYHEMGRCYLEVGDYVKAKECGHKSLNASVDKAWQLNASVLVAQAEGMSYILCWHYEIIDV